MPSISRILVSKTRNKVDVDGQQIGQGKQALIVVGVVFGSASLLILVAWFLFRPYLRRRRTIEAKVPTEKTNYTARYQFRGETKSCTMTLVFQRENEAGWAIRGTTMGQQNKNVRGRLGTFGSAEIELADGGMIICAAFDPKTGIMRGTWKKRQSSKESFPMVLEPQAQLKPSAP